MLLVLELISSIPITFSKKTAATSALNNIFHEFEIQAKIV